jgi:hypothetical protein
MHHPLWKMDVNPRHSPDSFLPNLNTPLNNPPPQECLFSSTIIRRHSLSPGGDMKQRAFSDSQERLSTPSTRTFSEAHDVSVQPAPLEINHPLAPENRQGEGLRIHPDSLDDLHPEDEFLQGPLHAPMRRGPPLEDGPPPPGIRAQSPEKSASFWCCC